MKAVKDAEKIADYIGEKGGIELLKQSRDLQELPEEKITEDRPAQEKKDIKSGSEPDRSQAESQKRNNLMRLRMAASR